ncbi:MAG: acyltransferase family protein [Weissella confusa]|nr:acyltransferase family protein [Weissella confusa]
MLEVRQRDITIDALKTVAIVLVVLNHVNENINISHGIEANVIQMIARTGVPIFLFATGYLLIDRDFFNLKYVQRFYSVNFINIFLSATFWTVVMSILMFAINIDVHVLLKNIFWQTKVLPQFWYIQALVIPYFLLPLFGYLRNVPKVLWLFQSVGVFVLSFQELTKAFVSESFSPFSVIFHGSMDTTIMMLVFMLFGYFVKQGLNRFQCISLVCSALLFNGVFILVYQLRGQDFAFYSQWYTSPWTMFNGLVFVLLLFRLMKKIKFSEFWKNFFVKISSLSYGIYILHYFVLIILKRYFLMNENLLSFVALLIGTFAISATLAGLMKKVKFLPKFVLL